MRILVVSNLYPPHFIGGYEIGCKQIVEALRSRGHSVHVLTSTYEVGRRVSDGGVYRWMEPEWSWPASSVLSRQLRLAWKEFRNQQAFRRLAAELQPHVVYISNPVMTSLSPARIAEDLGIPVAYLVSDSWLARIMRESDEWERFLRGPSSTFAGRIFRWLCARLGLVGSVPDRQLRGVQFVSDFLRREAEEAGTTLVDPAIIPWGVDTNLFAFRDDPIKSPQKLLYVGQILPHKGVHTCVEALHLLRADPRFSAVTLTVAGRATDEVYMERLQTLVRQHGLEGLVHFVGNVDRSKLIDLYHSADLLIFPSIWQEPFSITVIEAMSSGVPVVGTSTGGSAEILEDGVNALIFEAGDAVDCASRLARGLANPVLLESIRNQARETVVARYRFNDMVNVIEELLVSASSDLDESLLSTESVKR